MTFCGSPVPSTAFSSQMLGQPVLLGCNSAFDVDAWPGTSLTDLAVMPETTQFTRSQKPTKAPLMFCSCGRGPPAGPKVALHPRTNPILPACPFKPHSALLLLSMSLMLGCLDRYFLLPWGLFFSCLAAWWIHKQGTDSIYTVNYASNQPVPLVS